MRQRQDTKLIDRATDAGRPLLLRGVMELFFTLHQSSTSLYNSETVKVRDCDQQLYLDRCNCSFWLDRQQIHVNRHITDMSPLTYPAHLPHTYTRPPAIVYIRTNIFQDNAWVQRPRFMVFKLTRVLITPNRSWSSRHLWNTFANMKVTKCLQFLFVPFNTNINWFCSLEIHGWWIKLNVWHTVTLKEKKFSFADYLMF